MTTFARAKWQALGTSVELVVTDRRALVEARAILVRQLDEVDLACSRFREDSELMRVNAHAGRTVRVNPLLIEAMALALRAAELTDGDVDPTIGEALMLAGYDRDWKLLEPGLDRQGDGSSSAVRQRTPMPAGSWSIGRTHTPPGRTHTPPGRTHTPPGSWSIGRTPMPPGSWSIGASPAARVRATTNPGWKAVELDRVHATLRIPVGVKLDLGATAKAWAADRAAQAVHEATGCGVLVSLGGDISIAGPAPGELPLRGVGWRIHVTEDHRDGPDAPGQTISIASGGLATSSTTVRRWRHDEQVAHHIIDPSTGAPVKEVWRTVSVAAGDCADANIAATAAIVRGAQAPEWLAGLGLPARLVGCDGNVSTVGSWPREDVAP